MFSQTSRYGSKHTAEIRHKKKSFTWPPQDHVYTTYTPSPSTPALFVTDYIGTKDFALLLYHIKETENYAVQHSFWIISLIVTCMKFLTF